VNAVTRTSSSKSNAQHGRLDRTLMRLDRALDPDRCDSLLHLTSLLREVMRQIIEDFIFFILIGVFSFVSTLAASLKRAFCRWRGL
jgi:hypothetical protein